MHQVAEIRPKLEGLQAFLLNGFVELLYFDLDFAIFFEYFLSAVVIRNCHKAESGISKLQQLSDPSASKMFKSLFSIEATALSDLRDFVLRALS